MVSNILLLLRPMGKYLRLGKERMVFLEMVVIR